MVYHQKQTEVLPYYNNWRFISIGRNVVMFIKTYCLGVYIPRCYGNCITENNYARKKKIEKKAGPPHHHHITVTSKWVRWRLKSPASRMFIQPLFQAVTGEFPAHKWPVTRKMLPFDDVIMTYISWIKSYVCMWWFVLHFIICNLAKDFIDKLGFINKFASILSQYFITYFLLQSGWP